MTDLTTAKDELIAKGKAIVESGEHAPPRGRYLGRITSWGLDVFEGSAQVWKDALYEQECRDGV